MRQPARNRRNKETNKFVSCNMIGFDAEAGKIKHYRVDKMLSITLTNDKREEKEHFRKFDMAARDRMNFRMFGGEEVRVRLRFENDIVDVFPDRFGKDISIYKTDRAGWSETCVDEALSDQFLKGDEQAVPVDDEVPNQK